MQKSIKAPNSSAPKFGSPAWQAKYGNGKAKANGKAKTGK